MIKIDKAIIVEGKYDKIKLSSILDAVIIETDGFAIFKDTEKQKLIRALAKTRGIVILTDSDSAGFKIRAFIGGCVPPESVVHAYIPDIFGKEKRKRAPSKEGKLGLEGVSVKVIMEALEKAGVTCEETDEPTRRVTNTDFYEDGVSGGKNSSRLKSELLRELDLPSRLSTNALLKIINAFITFDEYKKIIGDCKEKLNEEDEKEKAVK